MSQPRSSLEATIVVVGLLLLVGGPALWWVFNRMDAPPKRPVADPLPTGPMPPLEIERIQAALGVVLPASYTQFLSTQSPAEVDGTSVMRDSDLIIEATSDYRAGALGAPCWPEHYLCIGDEDDACPYALNCKTGEVIETDHGDLNKKPIARYPTFELFISHFAVE